MDSENISDSSHSFQSTSGSYGPVDESEEEHENIRSSLSRFAYNNAPGALHGDPDQIIPTFKPASNGYRAANEKAIRAKHPRFVSDITNAQLEKLDRCVACQVKWRTRKSSAQKVLHLQSCSKKNALSEQTMLVLILRDIGEDSNTISEHASSGSNYNKQETLLETMVENMNAKTSNTKKHSNALGPVNVAHTEILDRAEEFFHISPTASLPEDSNELGVCNALPSTQVFGRSNFYTAKCGISQRR